MADKPTSEGSGQVIPSGTAAEAIADIEAYEKQYQRWEQRGEAIIKRYRDERSEASNLRVVSRKFNVLWANTETLKPTLYARVPQVQVERRFKDSDPVGRVACEIAERAGNYLIETTDFDNVQRLCVQDLLLPGRGTQWINYRADMSEPKAPMGEAGYENKGENGAEVKADASQDQLEKVQEMIEPIYVSWTDFGHSPRRTWQEVTRVWRVCHMGKSKLRERFGEELAEKIPLDRRHDDASDGKADTIRDTATIYEVWDKEREKVCWVHKSEKDYLDETDPPVRLEGFWPCPRPIWANLTNDTLIPVPLYALYQDQASELDKITNRIGRFTDGLKLAGVCDASVPELTRLLSPNGTPDNMLIPVANFAAMKEKGGIAGAVQMLPLADIANTLLSLYQAREQVLNVIYQVTGLADIIRGASNPNETATAQSIKGQFASLRIKDAQAEVARFSRDAARIIVEIAVEMYEPETLYEMVQAASFCKPTPAEQQRAQVLQQFGMPAPKPMEEFTAALRMLRNDKMRSFHVDIETDSTIALNEQEEKQNVVEFLTSFGGFLGSFGKIAAEMPAFAPVVGEALMFATRRFKAGRSLEGAIEKAVGQLMQQAGQPKPPTPEQQKAAADMEIEKAKLAADAELSKLKVQGDMTIEQAKLQADAARSEKEFQMKVAEQAAEMEFQRAKFQAELEQEYELQRMKIEADRQTKTAQHLASAWNSDREGQRVASASTAGADSARRMDEIMGHMTKALQAVAAPKQVLRDANGRVTGVTVVQ